MYPTKRSNLIHHVIVNDYVNITVENDIKLISITWQRQVSSDELRIGFYKAVEAAILYSCKYWLGDARKTDYLEIADQHWMVKELAALINQSEIIKLARIIKDDDISVLSGAIIKQKFDNNHLHHFNFSAEIFTEIEMARLWLLHSL